MDFSSFSSTESHEEGAWLHLRQPGTGEELYRTDDYALSTEETAFPCRVRVRGNRASIVKRVLQSRIRSEELFSMKMLRASDKEAERLLQDLTKAREAHQEELLVASISAWENIILVKGEKPAPLTSENILKAFGHPDLRVQIFKHAGDEEKLFQNAPPH